jgi:hypothetical protein
MLGILELNLRLMQGVMFLMERRLPSHSRGLMGLELRRLL